MISVVNILLGISVILFLGFFAEIIFKKFKIPDVLLLIIIGFIIGPYCFGYIAPVQIRNFMPVFTTFALLFLLYDGAFNISLKFLLKGAVKSLKITLFNFTISVIVVTVVMLISKHELLISLLTGFILGGISSAFVIPLLKQMKISGETYSVLTLESAITDVLCIVCSLTVIEVITLKTFSFQIVVSNIASLFAIAGLIGVLAGILWVLIVVKVFKENKFYMITIAYLILVYVLTEYLNGNGAIAALVFGLVLKNSKDLMDLFHEIVAKKPDEEKKAGESDSSKKGTDTAEGKGHTNGVSVTTGNEEFFYSQISFFLKTFFFVYIGVLFNISGVYILVIGGVIALSLVLSRRLSKYITKDINSNGRNLIMSISARGLAAAAIAQIVIMNNIEDAEMISDIVINVIVFTIILSSISIFLVKRKIDKDEENKEARA